MQVKEKPVIATECELMPLGRHLASFPDLARNLTTRFVVITPLSDSWDAQANRSCNGLSKSLLARFCSPCNANLEAFVENLAVLHDTKGNFRKRVLVRCIS
jgi:hypothetical protein